MLSVLGSSGLKPFGGLLAGVLYDPYPPRFVQKVQELLAMGVPLLARFHPGIRYPMDDEALHRTVDREGHVIALAGFNKATDTLLIADPWDKVRFGGEHGELYWEYAPIVTGIRTVDYTLDIVVCAFPLPVHLRLSSLGPKETKVTAEVTFAGPPGINLTAHMLRNVTSSIRLPEGLVLVSSQRRQRQSVLLPQERAQFHWHVLEKNPVKGEIQVAVVAIAKGVDPYPFQDVVGAVASVSVQSHSGEPAAVKQGRNGDKTREGMKETVANMVTFLS